jgi:hypothetical protein
MRVESLASPEELVFSETTLRIPVLMRIFGGFICYQDGPRQEIQNSNGMNSSAQTTTTFSKTWVTSYNE